MIYSIYIINKSGGVIFKQDSGLGKEQDDANDGVRMGALFYAFNSMSQYFSPVLQTGQLVAMESDNFSLKCIYTESGM